jgi:NADPH:quinone reductase
MRQVIAHAFGGPEQLIVQEASEVPRAGAGELLVDVEAAGVNFLEVMQRKASAPGGRPMTSARRQTPIAPSNEAYKRQLYLRP